VPHTRDATAAGAAPQIGQEAPDFTVNGAAADALTVSRRAVPAAVFLDPSGSVARLYAAKTTPHMFVIDKDGALRYMGGIDSLATTDEADIARAEPYLKEAMLAVAAGDPALHPVSKR
jgi:hypothetical protein